VDVFDFFMKDEHGTDPWGITWVVHPDIPSIGIPKEHPLVSALTGVFNECTGENAVPYVMGGGTYARKFPRALGFGLGLARRESGLFLPGHGGAHCPDEALDIDNFLKALAIFAMGVLAADGLMGEDI
jgi:succinyl-diaminopimelate desuccinylase